MNGPYLKRSQPPGITTVDIKFVLSVDDPYQHKPEVAMRASTSVVFAPIFEGWRLSFNYCSSTVNSRVKVYSNEHTPWNKFHMVSGVHFSSLEELTLSLKQYANLR